MKPFQFYVDAKFTIDGQEHRELCGPENWFMLSQGGSLFEYGPSSPLKPCEGIYDSTSVLIKIGEEFLSFEEVEKRIVLLKKLQLTISDLANKMDAHGITQKDLAIKMDCTQACISQMLSGKRILKPSKLFKINSAIESIITSKNS